MINDFIAFRADERFGLLDEAGKGAPVVAGTEAEPEDWVLGNTVLGATVLRAGGAPRQTCPFLGSLHTLHL